ncbi:hypothetical protein Syun_023133 [Stephania yunnanensis]|uniref:DUF4283 domain-containing protein n=1 Tax=Stephania yunnanensis TaxID=152371 RepID=A0AAP0FB95_9MAGN
MVSTEKGETFEEVLDIPHRDLFKGLAKEKGSRFSDEDELLDRSTKKKKLALVMVQTEHKDGVPATATFRDKMAGDSSCSQKEVPMSSLEEFSSFLPHIPKSRMPIDTLDIHIGELEIIGLDQRFLIVKFTLEDDYVRVLSEGPWVILDHYVGVQRWKPAFNPFTARFVSMPVMQLQHTLKPIIGLTNPKGLLRLHQYPPQWAVLCPSSEKKQLPIITTSPIVILRGVRVLDPCSMLEYAP